MHRDLINRTMSLAAVYIVWSQCQLVVDQLEGSSTTSTASDLQLQNTCLHSCCRSVLTSDNTRPWCGKTQSTTTFVGLLTVGDQIGWSHAGQWQVDQGGHHDIHPTDAESEASAALGDQYDVVVPARRYDHITLVYRSCTGFRLPQCMSSQSTNVTDRQTDGRTDGRHINTALRTQDAKFCPLADADVDSFHCSQTVMILKSQTRNK